MQYAARTYKAGCCMGPSLGCPGPLANSDTRRSHSSIGIFASMPVSTCVFCACTFRHFLLQDPSLYCQGWQPLPPPTRMPTLPWCCWASQGPCAHPEASMMQSLPFVMWMHSWLPDASSFRGTSSSGRRQPWQQCPRPCPCLLPSHNRLRRLRWGSGGPRARAAWTRGRGQGAAAQMRARPRGYALTAVGVVRQWRPLPPVHH